MRRAKLEGRQIGRARLDVNRAQVVEDRRGGMSLTAVAKRHSISRASVCRLMKEVNGNPHAAVMPPEGESRGASSTVEELLNMVEDKIGKLFLKLSTNGDLPKNPMSLRECGLRRSVHP